MNIFSRKNDTHHTKVILARFKCFALVVMLIFAFNPAPAFAKMKILAFGDSLTAGKGLSRDLAFPARLEAALLDEDYNVEVINAGVSGETTSGGLTRLAWVLETHSPDRIILTLGANDMMRAVDPAVTRKNLTEMLEILKEQRIPVLLVGMRSFRNLSLFGDKFQGIYKDLSDEYDTVYYPFFLSGVAFDTRLNQDDGLHPNAAGVGVIVENMMSSVEKLLKRKK